MSLYNDASLVMIPSAYKDGKLYSIKPTDGSGDFTFSRGSNLAATRVDENGLIEKGRENQIFYSNTFSSWSTSGTPILTSGQSGYDGSNDAWLFDANSGGYLVSTQSSSGVNTFSIYAKSATNDFLFLYNVRTGSDPTAYFNLSTGTTGTSANCITTDIVSVGNGWYRCSMTFTDGDINLRIYNGSAEGSLSDGTIYIQDAQNEQGLVATDYIETTTTTAQAGILEDMPRLDYSGGASCPSLLLEPQRTNIWLNSERVASWLLINASATSNTATSPSGYQDADTATATGTGEHLVYQNLPFVSGTTYTFSVFAKANTSNYIQMTFAGNLSANSYANFDLSNGTITASAVLTPKIEDYGNGWYRCSITATATSSTTNSQIIYLINSPTAPRSQSFTASGESVYLWGVQFEAGSYPTSYIPCYGAATTRSSDYMEVTPTDLLGSDSGTWFMELDDMTFDIAGTQVPTIYLGDSTTNCLAIEPKLAANNKGVFLVKEESNVSTTLYDFTISGKTKFCFVWNGTNLKVFRDGIERYSETSFTQPTNWDSFVFNHATREAFSKIPSILLFPTALTDSECIALTTL